MLPQSKTRSADRPVLAPAEHRAWRALISRRCGLEFGDTRVRYLERRLWQRVQSLGLGSFGAYHDRLRQDSGEWRELLELLVNRESSFFRHRPSFEALGSLLRERLGKVPPSDRPHRLNLWSAGCSTGQEPYSLAIQALDEALRQRVTLDLRVTGGDLSVEARDRTREGLYAERQLDPLESGIRRRYFERVATPRGPRYRVIEALRKVVEPRPWNATDPATYPTTPQDVVFCQNLLIYLPRDERPVVVGRLGRTLRIGGTLFLAPGEVLGLRLPGLEPVRFPDCLAFRRTS